MDSFDLDSGLVVAVAGLVVLIGLAFLIGLMETHSVRHAWRDIAMARRSANERSRRLDVRERDQDAREQDLLARELRLDPARPPSDVRRESA
jgi:hypothetical protein